jgi:hypothetical protein
MAINKLMVRVTACDRTATAPLQVPQPPTRRQEVHQQQGPTLARCLHQQQQEVLLVATPHPTHHSRACQDSRVCQDSQHHTVSM